MDHGNTKPDPTPEEIRDATAAIQSGWSEYQREQRAGVGARQPVTPLQCRAHCEEPWEDVA